MARLNEYKFNLGFDSILVRLKASTKLCVPKDFTSFDSILVRLKANSSLSVAIKRQRGFDSILVRLKVDNFFIAERLGLVSIPYWFD